MLSSFLEDSNLGIESIVTDRHPQIQKWLRENLPEVIHFYDVWHVAKGTWDFESSMSADFSHVKELKIKFYYQKVQHRLHG